MQPAYIIIKLCNFLKDCDDIKMLYNDALRVDRIKKKKIMIMYRLKLFLINRL